MGIIKWFNNVSEKRLENKINEDKKNALLKVETDKKNALLKIEIDKKLAELKINENERKIDESIENISVSMTDLNKKIKSDQLKLKQNKADEPIRCPKCGSVQVVPMKKGFGVGKAFVGVVATGGIGLLAGGIGANKVELHCLKCNKIFRN